MANEVLLPSSNDDLYARACIFFVFTAKTLGKTWFFISTSFVGHIFLALQSSVSLLIGLSALMTVTYTYSVANATMGGFMKLLLRWKGSIYKLVYREMIIYVLLYIIISISYHTILNEGQKETFQQISLFCDKYTSLIPLTFIFGFYVSLVVGRWWQQYEAIPWPDTLMVLISTYVNGDDERSRLIRRTMMRYINLTLCLTLQAVSISVRKRFPTVQHIVEAGFMTQKDLEMYEETTNQYGKWWIPIIWCCNLAYRAKREGRIIDPLYLKHLIEEIEKFRGKCGLLFSYDWISLPLVYTQVATIALYFFFIATLMARQYVNFEEVSPYWQVTDVIVHLFTFLQFFFYMGWLKVAEQLINPFGEDDDDFEMNWILDRNLQTSLQAVDQMSNAFPSLSKDVYWDDIEFSIPYTAGSRIVKIDPFKGSATNLNISPEEMEIIPMDPILEDVDNDSLCGNSLVSQCNSPKIKRRFSGHMEGFKNDLKVSKDIEKGVHLINNNGGMNGHLGLMMQTPRFNNQHNPSITSCPRFTASLDDSAYHHRPFSFKRSFTNWRSSHQKNSNSRHRERPKNSLFGSIRSLYRNNSNQGVPSTYSFSKNNDRSSFNSLFLDSNDAKFPTPNSKLLSHKLSAVDPNAVAISSAYEKKISHNSQTSSLTGDLTHDLHEKLASIDQDIEENNLQRAKTPTIPPIQRKFLSQDNSFVPITSSFLSVPLAQFPYTEYPIPKSQQLQFSMSALKPVSETQISYLGSNFKPLKVPSAIQEEENSPTLKMSPQTPYEPVPYSSPRDRLHNNTLTDPQLSQNNNDISCQTTEASTYNKSSTDLIFDFSDSSKKLQTCLNALKKEKMSPVSEHVDEYSKGDVECSQDHNSQDSISSVSTVNSQAVLVPPNTKFP